jgi:hypothetical protein
VQLADLAVRVDDGLSIAARRVAEWIHAGSPKNQILSTASADYIALSLVDGRLRLVTFGQDQRYQFLDNGQNLHNLVLLHASKQKTLASAIAELEALINDRRVTESALQRFFEMYPEVLLDEGYSRAHPHVVLSRQDGGVLVPDFVLEPTSQGRFCDLLELKLPRERIYAGTAARLRWSRAVMAARSQLREYSRYFDETPNRHYVLKTYGLNAYRPKLFVVIGRSASETSVVQRDLEVETPGLILKTYDDLLERAKHRLSLNGNAR